jgi:hypothetical protein
MENLDNYIREQIGNNPPDFNEQHWLAAQQFIFKKRKEEKRRAFLWWFFGICFLIGGGVLVYSQFNTSDKPAEYKIESHIALKDTDKVSPYNYQSQSGDSKISISTHSQNEKLKSSKNLSKTTTKSGSLSRKHFENISTDKIIKELNNQVVQNDIQQLADLSFYSGKGNSFRQSEILEASPEHQRQKEILAEHGNQREDEKQSELMASQSEKAVLQNTTEKKERASLAIDDGNNTIESAKSRVRFIDFGSGLVLNPSWSQGQLFAIGVGLGVNQNWLINEQWLFRIGLHYLHRWGTFNVMVDHPTPVYDFVKDDKGYSLIPTDAAFLQFQAGFGYQTKNWAFGIGITPAVLLGARGKVIAYQREIESADPLQVSYRSSTVSSGWIETPGFRRLHLEYGLFVEHCISSRLRLGLRTGMIPKGIVKEQYQQIFDHELSAYRSVQESGLLENRYQMSFYLNYRL